MDNQRCLVSRSRPLEESCSARAAMSLQMAAAHVEAPEIVSLKTESKRFCAMTIAMHTAHSGPVKSTPLASRLGCRLSPCTPSCPALTAAEK